MKLIRFYINYAEELGNYLTLSIVFTFLLGIILFIWSLSNLTNPVELSGIFNTIVFFILALIGMMFIFISGRTLFVLIKFAKVDLEGNKKLLKKILLRVLQ